jgi:hypothetical protein
MGYNPDLLDSVRIATPCDALWEEMTGGDRVRFCGACAKNVYNLSAMSREEAARLLDARANQSDLCLRVFQRADGMVLTEDCPVGVRKRRIRRVAVAAVGGGLMAAGLLSLSSTSVQQSGPSSNENVPIPADEPRAPGERLTDASVVPPPARSGGHFTMGRR